jgi:hypothetical protein
VTIVSRRTRAAVVRRVSESVRTTWEENFVDDMDHTVTRDDILREGICFSVVGICVDRELKDVLALEFFRVENISGNANGRFQSVDNITRPKLLGTHGINASSLRSLVVSSILLGVDGAVGLSASKIARQSGLRKNVELQKSLLIDSVDQTSNLREGCIRGSKDSVGRVSGRQKGLHVIVSVDKITEFSEGMTNAGINITIVGRISFVSTGTKITV